MFNIFYELNSGDDGACKLAIKYQQILIATHQKSSLANDSKLQKWQIKHVTTNRCYG